MILKENANENRTVDVITQIVAEKYFSRPAHALARFCDLAAYNLVELDVKQPTLDLGCGNGAVGSFFCRIHGLDGLDVGLEVCARSVRLAKREGVYTMVIHADGSVLPIKGETIGFILCNGVLCCIDPGYDEALREMARVLKPNGQLVMTVPTSRYTSLLIPTRIFTYLGLERLALLYARRVNKRNGHRVLGTPEWWHGELERTGLKIEKSISYFGTREAACWSILTMRPFQVCATLRYVPRRIQRIAVGFVEWVIRSAPQPGNADERSCGYVLFVARKSNGSGRQSNPL